VLREVVPAYIAIDLLVAIALVVLFAKVGPALGGGVKGGVVLGLFVAVFLGVAGTLYNFFSFTLFSANLVALIIVYELVHFAILGAVAGLVYKPGSSARVQ
jgi:hypothetical protein